MTKKTVTSMKLEEMLKSLDEFCINEYGQYGPNTTMSSKKMSLYAVDCGGYDTTDAVRLDIENGKFFLRVYVKNPEWEKYWLEHYAFPHPELNIPYQLLRSELELIPR